MAGGAGGPRREGRHQGDAEPSRHGHGEVAGDGCPGGLRGWAAAGHRRLRGDGRRADLHVHTLPRRERPEAWKQIGRAHV